MTGVDYHHGRWRARARIGQRKRVDLGRFQSKEAAEDAYRLYRQKTPLPAAVSFPPGPVTPDHFFKGKVFTRKKKHAKHRGLVFEIKRKDYPVPEVCPVLGIPLDSRDRDHTPSLDRVDNTLGYIPGNVVVISLRANTLKGAGTVEELEKVVAYIKHNQK